MQSQKEHKQRRDNQKRDEKKQRRPSKEVPRVEVSIQKTPKANIEITTAGGESIVGQKPEVPKQEGPVVQIVKPAHAGFTLEMSPEAIQAQKQRKISHTYTLEEMKARKTKAEISETSVFQFHAELQLYKRFMINGGSKRRAQVQMADAPVLQHRINTILSKFNVTTFTSVLNEICSLGINSDVFVLSFVNVVFKQAVLNPPLALIFSLLAKNVIYVQKHTRFAEKMKNLFLERCKESFVVPKADTDKGTVNLLLGIVTIAGNMIRHEVVKADLLEEWSKELLAANSNVALRLLIDFLSAVDEEVKGHEAIVKEIGERMKNVNDEQLNEKYNRIVCFIKAEEPDVDLIQKELHNPIMTHSPSMDTSLDGQYRKLFKKSESIPASLADLAEGIDEDDETIDGAVSTYFLSTNASNFVTTIEGLGLQKGTVEAAIELLKAIIRQPEANQLVVTQLAAELINQGFYDLEVLKNAIKSIEHESPEDEKACDVFARIFAILVNDKLLTFDDFDDLFKEMEANWKYIVPKFLFEIENLKGEINEDIEESEYWSTLKFTNGVDTPDKVTILGLWNILNMFPEYEAFAKLEEQKTGEDFVKTALPILETIKQKSFYKLLLEAVLELPEAEQGKAIDGLKQIINKNKAAFNEAAEQVGDKAKALLK